MEENVETLNYLPLPREEKSSRTKLKFHTFNDESSFDERNRSTGFAGDANNNSLLQRRSPYHPRKRGIHLRAFLSPSSILPFSPFRYIYIYIYSLLEAWRERRGIFFFLLLLLLSFFFFFCWRCYRPPSSDVDTVVVRATYLRFLLLPSFSLLFPLPPCWFVLFLSLSLYRSRDSLTWNYALVAREYEIRRSSHARRAYNEGTNQKQEPSV